MISCIQLHFHHWSDGKDETLGACAIGLHWMLNATLPEAFTGYSKRVSKLTGAGLDDRSRQSTPRLPCAEPPGVMRHLLNLCLCSIRSLSDASLSSQSQ